MSAWGGPFGGAIDKIVALEARVKELQEHFDGCAGAEATINDWRARAEAAEARVKELEAERDDAKDGERLAEEKASNWRWVSKDPEVVEKLIAAEKRVKELETLLHRQAGRWTLCTVCGATVRNATAREIVHRTDCAMAKATGAPRGIDELAEFTPEQWAEIEKRKKP